MSKLVNFFKQFLASERRIEFDSLIQTQAHTGTAPYKRLLRKLFHGKECIES
jgi:hypothetical protein